MQPEIKKLSREIENISHSSFTKAKLILQQAHESSKFLLTAFDRARKRRGGKRGGTTDEEQDILRSMLVLASAGFDSMTKQVIRDCITALAEKDEKVRQGMETFVVRRIKSTEDEGLSTQSVKFIAGVLACESPRKRILEEYINSLVGGSMQSPEELYRAVYALGLEPNSCDIKQDICKNIFDIRNKIIHELDINFAAKRRRRHVRRRKDMIDNTNRMLTIAENILLQTWNRLK